MTYTTASLVQAELKSTTAFSVSTVPTLAQVEGWITELSSYINTISGRTYSSQTVTETIDYNGEEYLVLRNAPLISVTEVLYSPYPLGNASYGLTDTLVAGQHYEVYQESGEILLLLQNWAPQVGRKRMSVEYTSGYTVTPLTIQMLCTKLVTKRVLDVGLASDVNTKAGGKSINIGGVSIVRQANFGISQYEQLKKDIDKLTSELTNGTTAYRIGTHRF